MYSSRHRGKFCQMFWLVTVLVCCVVPWMVEGQGENLANEIPRLSSGSCRVAGKCCQGRNSSCVVQKAPENAIIEDLNDVPCYCDHACLTIGDCCSDFKDACGVQDCQVSHWGHWGHCDVDCGQGVMVRSRSVLVGAKNGGKTCPSLIQKRGCRGTRCHHIPNRINFEDTAAIILPVAFSANRKANTSSDLTRNLRLRYPKNPAREKSKPYCVEYQVIRSTRACRQMASFVSLYEGNHVCVICEREAQRAYLNFKCAGTSSINSTSSSSPPAIEFTENARSTRFSSLREPACHGIWKQKSSIVKLGPDFVCSCSAGAQFIFV